MKKIALVLVCLAGNGTSIAMADRYIEVDKPYQEINDLQVLPEVEELLLMREEEPAYSITSTSLGTAIVKNAFSEKSVKFNLLSRLFSRELIQSMNVLNSNSKVKDSQKGKSDYSSQQCLYQQASISQQTALPTENFTNVINDLGQGLCKTGLDNLNWQVFCGGSAIVVCSLLVCRYNPEALKKLRKMGEGFFKKIRKEQ